MQVASLQTLATDLKTKNTAVLKATAPYSNSLITRNKKLYDKPAGLVDIAYEVKKYVKSVFGATSPEYKQISGIEYTRPR